MERTGSSSPFGDLEPPGATVDVDVVQYGEYKRLARAAREWRDAKQSYRRFTRTGAEHLAECERRLEDAVASLTSSAGPDAETAEDQTASVRPS